MSDPLVYERTDYIRCLECGKDFQSLGVHLRAHGLSREEYRSKHHLPENHALATKSWFDALQLKRASKALTQAPDVYYEFVERVKKGRSVHQVAEDEDMPAQSQFHRACKRWPALAKALKEAYQTVVKSERRSRFLAFLDNSGRFQSKESVIEYLSSDTVVCLECGREYVNLGSHLKMAHDINPDDYRLARNIPVSMGLCAAGLRETFSKNTKARHESGELTIAPANPASSKTGRHQRPHTSFHQDSFFAGHKAYIDKIRADETEKYEEVIKRVMQGRPLYKVCEDPDMPSGNSVLRYAKRNKEFQKKLKDAQERRKHKR